MKDDWMRVSPEFKKLIRDMKKRQPIKISDSDMTKLLVENMKRKKVFEL